mmetsp:Transcript_42762/g.118075  ORF Transcript_42762/g.118075 Transcript_42762/m.118075 type:complete len:775 (+) Transcript_42762:58-2382(+)
MTLQQWPLSAADADHLEQLKELYTSVGVSFDDELFQVESKKEWFITRRKAKNPVTEDKLRRWNHADPPNFLSPQAQTIEDSLLEFQKVVCLSTRHRRGYGGHLPVVLIAQEFRNWTSRRLAKLVSADDNGLEEIKRRIDLIYRLQDNEVGLSEFKHWHESMISVTQVLRGVFQRWPVFNVQETIQDSLKHAETLLSMTFYNLVMYLFFVLRGDASVLGFSPMTFNGKGLTEGLKRARSSTSGRVMSLLLLDPVVAALTSLHNADGELPQLQAQGSNIVADRNFPQMDTKKGCFALASSLCLATLSPLTEPSTDQNGNAETGLVSVEASGINKATYVEAVTTWLRLHSWASGVARSHKLLGITHKISSLGGDLLLAEYANKERAQHILAVVSKGLSVVSRDCESLDKVLRVGINTKLRSQDLSWLGGDSDFVRWHLNNRAAQQYKHDMIGCIQAAQEKIAKVQSRIHDLDLTELRKQTAAKSRELFDCLQDTCTVFKVPHDLEQVHAEHVQDTLSEQACVSSNTSPTSWPKSKPVADCFVDGFWEACRANWFDTKNPLAGKVFKLQLTEISPEGNEQATCTRRNRGGYLDACESPLNGDEFANGTVSKDGSLWEFEPCQGIPNRYRLKLVGPVGAPYVGGYLDVLPGKGRACSRTLDSAYVVVRELQEDTAIWRVAPSIGIREPNDSCFDMECFLQQMPFEIRLIGPACAESRVHGGLLDAGQFRWRFQAGNILRNVGAAGTALRRGCHAFVETPDAHKKSAIPAWFMEEFCSYL